VFIINQNIELRSSFFPQGPPTLRI
jgi:hypothetical protein